MSDEVLQFLIKLKDEGHDHCWQCKICSKAMKAMGQRVTKLEKAMVAVEKKVDDNTNRISDTEETVKVIQDRVDGNEKKLTDAITGAANAAEEAVLKELEEREAKGCNLIIHNMKELDHATTTDDDRKKSDLDILTEMLKMIGSKTEIRKGVKFTARLGKSATEGQENARPLLVGFATKQHCMDVLSAAKNLAKSTLAYLSIAPDLTKKQREADNELRDEKDKRNRELPRDEAKNWEWKLLGIRGNRRLMKVKRHKKRPRSGTRQDRDTADASPPRARSRPEVAN